MKLRAKYKKYRRLYEQMAQLPVKYNIINTPMRAEKIGAAMIVYQNWVPEKAVTKGLKQELIDHAEKIGAIRFLKEPALDPDMTRYSAYMKVLIESEGKNEP